MRQTAIVRRRAHSLASSLATLLWTALCALLVLLASGAHADEPPRRSNSFEFVDALNEGVRVQRSFTRRREGRRIGVVHVYWTNQTASSFSSHVELQCIALGPDGLMINSMVGRLDAKKVGEMEPGFRGRLVLSLDLEREVMQRMSCSVVDVR